MVVPDYLYEQELQDPSGASLLALGLSVVSLSPLEVQLAQDISNSRLTLSTADSFALACASRPDHLLLAGDGPLRAEAKARGIQCNGLLWLMDQMLNPGQITKAVLHEGLSKIFRDARCRLPKSEVEKRLKTWAS
jgi:hypothetical protein